MSSKKNNPKHSYDFRAIRAVIGLGNPGSKYYKTRHSIGFRVADELVIRRFGSWQDGPKQELSEIRFDGDMYDTSCPLVYIIKPLTFMNSSGQVLPFLQKKGIKPEEILVVHDELEKPFSHVSLHKGGGAKGHNGLRSIIDMIGKEFWRIRFGVGRPTERDQVGDFVLAPFSREEEEDLPFLIQKAADLIVGSGK